MFFFKLFVASLVSTQIKFQNLKKNKPYPFCLENTEHEYLKKFFATDSSHFREVSEPHIAFQKKKYCQYQQ